MLVAGSPWDALTSATTVTEVRVAVFAWTAPGSTGVAQAGVAPRPATSAPATIRRAQGVPQPSTSDRARCACGRMATRSARHETRCHTVARQAAPQTMATTAAVSWSGPQPVGVTARLARPRLRVTAARATTAAAATMVCETILFQGLMTAPMY